MFKISRIWVKCFFKPGFKKVYKKFRKKYFVWKKKKKKKALKHKQNFFFFFTKKRKRWPRISIRWLKFQLSFSNTPLDILSSIENRLDVDFKKRYPLRLKNKVLKKRALKLKLKTYYKINKSVWNSLAKKLKKKKNKLNYILHFFESRLATVCVRFHFFWTLKRAQFWVSKGSISVNSLIVLDLNYILQINDFVQVSGPKVLWSHKLMTPGGYYFHSKFYKTFNSSEISFKSRSGVLLKLPTQINEFRALVRRRRKTWINIKTFLYLVNSFY
jgi:ribosomal protein S4